jgi:hypothetical protein
MNSKSLVSIPIGTRVNLNHLIKKNVVKKSHWTVPLKERRRTISLRSMTPTSNYFFAPQWYYDHIGCLYTKLLNVFQN